MLNVSIATQRKLFDQYFEARKSVYSSNVTFDIYKGYTARLDEAFTTFIRDCMDFASQFEPSVTIHCRNRLMQKYGERAKTTLSQLY